jgi:hypothetical protein
MKNQSFTLSCFVFYLVTRSPTMNLADVANMIERPEIKPMTSLFDAKN